MELLPLKGKKLYVAKDTSCLTSELNLRRYEKQLLHLGAESAKTPQNADYVLVDTCALSVPLENHSVALIKENKKKASPQAKVIACGCLAAINPSRLNGVTTDFFSPNEETALFRLLDLPNSYTFEERSDWGDLRASYLGQHTFQLYSPLFKALVKIRSLFFTCDHYYSLNEIPFLGRVLAHHQYDNPNAFGLRISQGCLGTCTFCAIPKGKGKTKSVPFGAIIEKVRELVETGVKRLVFASEDTGAYGVDIGTSICDLLEAISKIPGNFTIHIQNFDPRWLVKFKNRLPEILSKSQVRHLELPLQSSNNSTLARMRRAYQMEHILPVIKDLREKLPHLVLTTHVIAGFPGETLEDFEKERAFFRQGLFDHVWVFEYSTRPGTEAADYQEHLSVHEIKRRAKLLRKDFRMSFARKIWKRAFLPSHSEQHSQSGRDVFHVSLFLFLVVFFSSFPLLAKTSMVPKDRMRSSFRGVERAHPVLSKSIQGGRQNCYVFKKFIVLEIDSAQKGAEAIYVRTKQLGRSLKVQCDAAPSSQDRKLPENEHYVLGAKGSFLFTLSADSFGSLERIGVYDFFTGKGLFEANFNSGKLFQVISIGKSVSLKYDHHLKVSCSLAENTEACWKQIQLENGVPLELKLPVPDCQAVYGETVFKGNPDSIKEPGVIQVFVPVKIADVLNPHFEYLRGLAFCSLTP